MLCSVYCATCLGLTAVTVTVEVDFSRGLGICIVGLPDSAVKESLMRVVTALKSFGVSLPGKKIVINLAPADIRKEGSSYDLAIATALLCAMERIPAEKASRYIIMGELALSGDVRKIRGALPIAAHAAENGFSGCILPYESACEAVDIEGIDIYGVHSIEDAVAILCDADNKDNYLMRRDPSVGRKSGKMADLKDVKGQHLARRGLEIAAAGGHNLIMIGSPGCGKTLMASCMPSILPAMSREESVETSKIYSVCGISSGERGLMRERPFRSPHNSASITSLLGGGKDAMPGEISLAHNGVLYLDEIAQFQRTTLDYLRQPLEDGKVCISRARYRVEYPCSFMLVASMNPCPCGYYGDKSGRCHCTRAQVENYLSRISGPMMDRIDLQIFVERITSEELTSLEESEPSSAVAQRVAAARQIQIDRFKGQPIYTNARMDAGMIKQYCQIDSKTRDFFTKAAENFNLSARSCTRILKLARTIADLAGREMIDMQCISEAMQFRNLDRMESI